MNVTLLFGFLGAGKTTLLRGLLPQLARRERVAVLVNEFGDVGIDGEVLATGDLQVKEMASGCICCELIGDMVRALTQIHEGWNPERLIIEPTGVAAPQPLLQLLASSRIAPIATLDRVVTVVDTPRFAPSREVFAAFYTEQIRCAHALVLNKVDKASPEEVAEVAAVLAEINPRAQIRATTFGRVPLEWLVGDGAPAYPADEQHGHLHVEDSSSGLVAHALETGCVPRAALERVLAGFDAGEFGEIIRAKGLIETPSGAVHVEYVPGEFTFESYAGERRAFVVTGRGVKVEALRKALGWPPVQGRTGYASLSETRRGEPSTRA